jgi:hypothetical protein
MNTTEGPRRIGAGSILAAAPALAITALAAAPLAAATRIGAAFGAPHAVAMISEQCHVALATGALGALKYPDCGGD